MIGLMVMGCEPESTELDTQVFNLPEWLKGDYEGVHTGEYLRVSNKNILFKVEEIDYQFQPAMIISETVDENHYIIITESDVLIFNKTTLQEEINFQFNDFNLGWFRNEIVE
ncbi:MAG: hypothetical protein CVU07_02500 [Bacteroidetes bacterium HGW-Bacteroidetes-23]|nr:MAG: hypothetical protein CVU07_02500 [Bacteroidetes bacterium HGW-Bacteroidetes-23]